MADKKKFDFMQPLKDIPSVAKGLPKSWMNMVKTPIKTPEQLEQHIKEVWAFSYLTVMITALFLILSVIPGVGGIFMIIGVLFMIPTLITVCRYFVISQAKKRFALLTCNECNTLLSIDTPEEVAQFVTYAFGENDLKNVSMRGNCQDGVYDKITVHGQHNLQVKITIKCPHCGATKTFGYRIFPFKAQATEGKISQRDLVVTEKILQDRIAAVLDQYKEDSSKIPFTTHSIHHPKYNNSMMNNDTFTYNGVSITYHRTGEEMIEGLFIRGEQIGHFE